MSRAKWHHLSLLENVTYPSRVGNLIGMPPPWGGGRNCMQLLLAPAFDRPWSTGHGTIGV